MVKLNSVVVICMNELLNSIYMAFVLILLSTLLIRFSRNKSYNIIRSLGDSSIWKEESFKVVITQNTEPLNATMTLLNEKISISGDMVIDIPFEQITSIKFPYALNTVTYQKKCIIRSFEKNFFISPYKLMSNIIINFFNDKNEMVTLDIMMQESKCNFRVNKIARIRFMNIIKTVRKQLAE